MQTSISLSLDKRRLRKGDKYTIILRISHFQRTTSISTGYAIQEEFWDDKKKRVKAKYKGVKSINTLNQILNNDLAKAQKIINELHLKENLDYISIKQLKDKITSQKKYDSFYEYGSLKIMELKESKRYGTARSYKDLISRLKTFTKKRDLKFNEINYDFLKRFERFHMTREGNSLNGLASYLRTLRAIYNKGLKEGYIDKEAYPFQDYKIKTVPTAKRAINPEYIKKILELELEKGSWPFHYRNYFILSYMLFGMSFVDMAFLKKENIVHGRIKFQRKKTSKNYDIKLTEPLKKILEFYLFEKTKDDFILPVLSPSENLAVPYKQIEGARKRYNRGLQKIAEQCCIEEHLTSYVSRHSFATHALLQNVPLPAISAMLGHTKLNTTQIYLKSLPTDILDGYQEQLNKI